MKKKVLLAMALTLILMVFAGCGADMQDSEYLGTWKGYEVFAPTFDDDAVHYIVFPQFILCKDGTARWTQTRQESIKILSIFYKDE